MVVLMRVRLVPVAVVAIAPPSVAATLPVNNELTTVSAPSLMTPPPLPLVLPPLIVRPMMAAVLPELILKTRLALLPLTVIFSPLLFLMVTFLAT